MTERDTWTAEAMIKQGGSFVKTLGELMYRADPDNLHRIKKAWPEYIEQYEAVGKKIEESRGE